MQYNLLFRWFIGLSMDDAVWVPTVFTKNRERLIEHDVVVALFNEIVAMADAKGWLSGEHFSVDGTLIQAWAGHKSFVQMCIRDSLQAQLPTGLAFLFGRRSAHRHGIGRQSCQFRFFVQIQLSLIHI